MLRKLCIAMGLSSVLITPHVAWAQIDDVTGDIGSELDFASMEDAEALLTLIQLVESNIATKTNKLDKDYLPGLVSVLTGDEMKARGVRTIKEALNLVPGMHLATDRLGFPTPVLRGIGGVKASGSGKTKFLLNGTPLNSSQSGLSEFFWDIPVEQVSRIEVIRGPGSAIYGEYAYMGVVNVVTYNAGNFGYAGGGGNGTKFYGGLIGGKMDDGPYLSINTSVRHVKGDEVESGLDGIYPLLGENAPLVSNAPGDVHNERHHFMAVLNTGYHGDNSQFDLKLQQLELETGSYFGLSNFLQENDEAEYVSAHRGADATFKVFDDSWSVNAKLGWRELATDFADFQAIPAFFPFVNPQAPEAPPTYYVDGLWADSHYKEKRTNLGISANYTGFDHHNLLVGIDYSITESFDSLSVGRFTLAVAPDFPQVLSDALIPNGLTREVTSLYLQDQYAVTNSLEVTLGARFDHYSDSDDSFSPRLAAVYQLSDFHLLKAQYGEAFRPPTYTELFSLALSNEGDPELEPETIKTAEFAYIYKSNDKVGRATIFYSELDDLISLVLTSPSDGKYQNGEGASSYGVELEWEQQFNDNWKLIENLSYVKTEDDASEEELAGSYNWLANVGVLYQPNTKYSVALDYRFVDSAIRELNDSRSEVDALHTVDLTVSMFQAAGTGFTLRLGAKNLFDEEVVYPAPAGTYMDDYPQDGRKLWAEVMLQF
ncbi:MAG: hypothetical protein CMF25_01155 [Kangiellaceae bacterium]|nr:hypothetical protein [Kangiellaceae bacterium]|tara:strand:- start:4910 stop:7048 length:2139 start_codon:yes stop_codon:yes gene_type:complete